MYINNYTNTYLYIYTRTYTHKSTHTHLQCFSQTHVVSENASAGRTRILGVGRIGDFVEENSLPLFVDLLPKGQTMCGALFLLYVCMNMNEWLYFYI